MSDALSPSRRPLVRFLLVAAGLYLLWFFLYDRNLALDGRLDGALSRNIAAAGAGMLRVFGFNTHIDAAQPRLLVMDGRPGVIVGDPCNGLVLYALFAGFVLAFPGGGVRKLWFIPLGIAAIYLLNVVRVAALALNHHYYRQSVEFNHHYTFTFVVYGAILLLWAGWVRQLPRPTATVAEQPATGAAS